MLSFAFIAIWYMNMVHIHTNVTNMAFVFGFGFSVPCRVSYILTSVILRLQFTVFCILISCLWWTHLLYIVVLLLGRITKPFTRVNGLNNAIRVGFRCLDWKLGRLPQKLLQFPMNYSLYDLWVAKASLAKL